MNNSNFDPYAIQQPKKKSNILTIIVGAVLALNFLFCCLYDLMYALITTYDSSRYLLIVHDLRYDIFFRGPCAYFCLLTASLCLFLYAVLAAILKGKKMKYVLLIAFISLLFAHLFFIISVLYSMIQGLYPPHPIYVIILPRILPHSLWCLTAIIGIVLCFVNKKTSMIIGITGAGTAFLTFLVYFVINILKIDFDPSTLLDLCYTSLSLFSIMAVFLLLRPAKD